MVVKVRVVVIVRCLMWFFFFSSRRRHTRFKCDWSSDVCSSDLAEISRSRTDSKQGIERARILLAYAHGAGVSEIARTQRTNRPRVERTIDKALQIGAVPSLHDLAGRGRKCEKTSEAIAWMVALACQKPKDLGYAAE